jgi:DNA invertase Pin-like site-specific DNA recombinase
MIYGYARVSTDRQSIDAQVLRQLQAAGAATVFPEVASGAKADGAQLGRLLAQLDELSPNFGDGLKDQAAA